jgi:hypothetical protein
MNQQTADGKEELYKFRCKVGEKTFEHIMTYNKMLEWHNRDLDKDDMYQIEAIIGHKKDSKAKGGYQLHVKWSSGETTWQDVTPLYQDNPTSVSVYAMKNDLLNKPGFKHCKHHTKNHKTLTRMIYQARLKNFHNQPWYIAYPRDDSSDNSDDEFVRYISYWGNQDFHRGNQ